MPVKLLVTRTTDDASADEYIFDRDTITIGRDASSHLTLPDLKRVVSKRHAELRRSEGAYQIVDLGSKNFTFLNDERLQASRPYDLKYGDLIRIGDFEIRLEPELAAEPDHDGTVFDVHFVNPFAEDVARLADVLSGIRDAFEQEVPSRREDALRDALQETLAAANIVGGVDDAAGAGAGERSEAHTAYLMIARLLAPYAPPAEPPSSRIYTPPPTAREPDESPSIDDLYARPDRHARPERHDRPDHDRPDRRDRPHRHDPHAPSERADPSPPPRRPQALDSRVDTVLDTLLQAAARLVNIPWQFRHEFIGQTIMQSAETAAIFSGEAEALRAYLLDHRIPADEAERRRQAFEDAAEDVARHQVAMMDGYKAGAHEGTQRLLAEFDPVEVESEVRNEDALSRFLAPLAKIRALDRLKQKMQELKAQDWSAAERRIFRPAFIKAYLARMTSLRK